jgi:hypothetical protein
MLYLFTAFWMHNYSITSPLISIGNLQNSKTSKRLKKLNKKLSKLKAIGDQSNIQNLVTSNNSIEAGNVSSELAQSSKIKLSPLKRGKELLLYDDVTKGSEGN